MKRSFGFAAAALVLMAGSAGASVKPVLLKNFGELRSGRVRILAQYLAPGTFEVKMDETFDGAIHDGHNQAGAFFFREGEGL